MAYGPCVKGKTMSKRYKQAITIDGTTHWISGKTIKSLLEAYLALCIEEGVVLPPIVSQAPQRANTPVLEGYLSAFNKTYKNNQQSLTKTSREYVTQNFILPRWGKKHLDEITTDGIQQWMNQLAENGYSHETLLKIKNFMSPALDAAVEDGYLPRNPFRSPRLTIGGTETSHHKAVPPAKMAEIRLNLQTITDPRCRMMAALLCYTGMRLEEILGLTWPDLDHEDGWLYIRRAVVHPTRNLPEVKPPKTKTSCRRIPLPESLWQLLYPRQKSGYVLGGDSPLTYTESRNCFNRFRKLFSLDGFSAHDFRDTCATEWRESGIPIDVISHLLGHAKSDITENRYVKYRDQLYQGVRAIMDHPILPEKGTTPQV